MGTENRLDELQVHTQECNVWRWYATDIYFLCSRLHFSSQDILFFKIYLSPFLSITYLTLIGLSAMHASLKNSALSHAAELKAAVLYQEKNNNWVEKQQYKYKQMAYASRLKTMCTISAQSLLQVHLLNSKKCLTQTLQIAWSSDSHWMTLRVTQAIKVLFSELHCLGSHYNESSFNLHFTCRE